MLLPVGWLPWCLYCCMTHSMACAVVLAAVHHLSLPEPWLCTSVQGGLLHNKGAHPELSGPCQVSEADKRSCLCGSRTCLLLWRTAGVWWLTLLLQLQ